MHFDTDTYNQIILIAAELQLEIVKCVEKLKHSYAQTAEPTAAEAGSTEATAKEIKEAAVAK